MTTVLVTNGTESNSAPASILLFNPLAAERKLCGPLRARQAAQDPPCR